MSGFNRRTALKLMGAAASLGLADSALPHGPKHDFPPRRRFVLIHGAWHNGTAWDGVADRLRGAGHAVEAPTLPGMNPGDNRAGIQFGDYVDAIVEVLEQRRVL